MEAVNEGTKLLAQAIENLKEIMNTPWIPPFDVDLSHRELLESLEQVLDKLTKAS